MTAPRIGIMGGMFDPVHRGHLAAATAALDALGLESLHLVPCAQPNHRQAAIADGQQRLAMLQLAAGLDERLQVDDREIRRPGVSYAVDTLASFSEQYPDADLVFVLGWDSFLSLPCWHRWQDMFAFAHFCAVSRPGVTEPVPEALAQEMAVRAVTSSEVLFSRHSGNILVLDGVQVDVSSTQLRQARERGALDESLLPATVAAYIRQHALY
jgi:nicotinate-nucleotide adenylyltransferase